MTNPLVARAAFVKSEAPGNGAIWIHIGFGQLPQVRIMVWRKVIGQTQMQPAFGTNGRSPGRRLSAIAKLQSELVQPRGFYL